MKHKILSHLLSLPQVNRPFILLLVGSTVLFSAFNAHAGVPSPAKEPTRQPHPVQTIVKDQPRQPNAAPKEQPRQAPPPRVNPVASELECLSGSAEDIFELAAAGKIDRIPKKLESLKRTAASLPVIQDESNSVLLSRLKLTVGELELALAGKDRLEIMRFANRLTLIAATVGIQFRPGLPGEVPLLDYNARELGIWSESKRSEKLATIVMRMHLTWQTLMPKLVDRNATKELKRFSEVMGRLEMAKTSEEYGRLSKQAGSELASIKAVFLKNGK